MSDEVIVHGRDFTRYRIWGGIVAALLFVALILQVWFLFFGEGRTVPEIRWGVTEYEGTPMGAQDAASALLTGTALADRTTFQAERYQTGPSPEEVRPDYSVVPNTMMTTAPMDDGGKLTEGWSIYGDDTGALLRPAQRTVGISSLPYPNAALFERPFARDWRLGIADIATHLGALAILGMSFLLALILAVRGRVPIAHGRSGVTVKRFNLFERSVHWMTSVSFIALAITGLTIAFGKTLLAPFGETALGMAGWISTWGHMMFFPSFAVGIVLMAVLWMGRNIPERADLHWLRKLGGMATDGGHVPAKKFNAGQKLIFWSAVLGGALMVVSGVTLMFPYYWASLGTLSWAMLAHAVIGLMLIAIFIGHIYIGTVGMQGAFWAMWGGRVDRQWAKEHHSIWLDRIEGRSGRDRP